MIQPNLHIALIHIPIGLLVVGLLIELFSFLYRGSNARTAARWMIGIGALSMIPVAASGVYALSDTARRSMPPGAKVDTSWVDVLSRTDLHNGKTGASDAEGDQWRMVSGHIWRAGPATALAVLVVLIWMGSSDRLRRNLYIPSGILLIGATAVMLWGAWMGGEAVYRHGTAVQMDQRRNLPAAMFPTTQPGAAREMTEARTAGSIIDVVPPLQTHIVVAGLAIAAALAAMALAFRNAASVDVPLSAEDEEKLLTGVAEPGVRPAVPHDLAMLRSFKPAAAMSVVRENAPAARFWLLTCLLAVVSSALGLWFLAGQTDAGSRASHDNRSIAVVLWETIKTPAAPLDPTAPAAENPLNLNRRLAHVVGGLAIIVLPLLMAALARWAPRRKWILSMLSVVLVAVLGVQIWLGILMTLDTPAGSILKFNPAEVTTAK
ncbi:DUF2231 domain-containing protein [Humisphaera borealis]|uniref:DUF2231 domain-containing protein n=1 Tax=Humisphaera borealis TaxID=2807512 RepID=A0A7M2X146_9BACT|nr:DUF2231 domain-containing protein [Humisphaera borealis]QOV91162.1 hypothetical protein IPV69_07330 [Humisphaera borealis]